jgi:membrane protease YdiL (CAAX protease family)
MPALFHTRSGTLRAPWRLLAFFGSSAAFSVPLLFLRTLLPAPVDAPPFGMAWDSLALSLALLVGTWYALRRIDGRPWRDAWMGRAAAAPGRLVGGFALGMMAIGLPALALVAVQWLRFVPTADGSSLQAAWVALLLLAPAALFEELAVRGYAMAALREALGWWPAILLTSLVFGVLHAWNPGATAMSVGLVTLAGVFLGVIVMATGSLWAATAAHLAWNWTMAALLHAPVSGLGLATPDYRLLDAGPDWATGGTWGPEGGAGAAVGMILGTAYLYARRRRRREET